MRRIGISQRVEIVSSYGECRDCLDQRWSILLEQLGMLPVPVPNRLDKPQAWLREMALDGFILSGGNDLCHLPDASNTSQERDSTEQAILKYASETERPVLGVCRGLQMINIHLGGRLRQIEGHIAKLHPVHPMQPTPLFSHPRIVNSFHGWTIPKDGLGKELSALVRADGDSIEAVQHTRLPWFGIMWHPEREDPFLEQDIELLKSLFEN
jgi:putative glutamine amidotransferase